MNKLETIISTLNFDLAIKVLIILPSLLILFHICNLFGLVPQNIVWTGRITSERTMLLMGMVSILLNAVIIFCALVKANYINNKSCQSIVEKILPILFWWLLGNSVVNLFSKSNIEVIVFTPILIILTICCFRIKSQSALI